MKEITATSPQTKFRSGQTVITVTAREQLSENDVRTALKRHLSGDWGDCDPEDAAANEQALLDGDRLLSVYHAADGTKLWIITEADRSATTVLLPEEY
ncbi:hypothetical protein SH661x_002900 [Planctomicrobium sp. SH661]|uniref:hypothetical protein n=1 Tax=Planctomicrobium sp. SH661 TaxID=3448124 RepID=UPI003F5B28B1